MQKLERPQMNGFATGIVAVLASTFAAGCASDSTDPAASPVSTESAELRGGHPRGPTLTPQTSGTQNRLQAVSPVDARVVWASGVGGTFTVTTDGGRTWRAGVVAGAESREFRDVQGVSERVAYLLAAGVGADSAIYKTVDGGATWTQQFQNQDPNGFYDCFAFWNRRRALVMGDSVNGRFPVLRTTDGQTWTDIGDRLPPAQTGEAAFAASGTCVAVEGHRRAWIATGGAAQARVLLTTDGGDSWTAVETPIIQGTPSSGGTSIAFRDARHGVLGGGEIAAPTEPSQNFARSRDGGRSWQLATPTPFPGGIYGLAYAVGRLHDRWDFDDDDDRGEHGRGDDGDDGDDHGHGHGNDHSRATVVATGPSGAAWSPDEGGTWSLLPDVTNYWATAFASARTGWLVGTEGRILRVDF
jgi:photosystem II stability/assembly factor-like uncharacterized protein